MSTAEKPKHIGRNISRIRELKGIKQEALAFAIGVSQQSVSNIEASENVDDEKLIEIAKALDVTVEALKNFSEENMITYFNTFNDSQGNFGDGYNGNNCSFNPLDKLIEAFDENKKLYERLVLAEKEKVEYLEKILKEK
ncbi:DNA-binding XRE family transcriptional regulator [Flavobacterium araucananum]|uniref:Transcriptional regulator n=1 Tax=Flavobacterium araucananum TaxID=946678 RepID=A0A227PE19_9FLAO|nr:helix-turn-helix transcriptional regulator [Flavobacterium araucananum]OXG07753.1 transcriptional regulator [Flavobacterium araucananum]PWK02066.1 DNA-binding XRE family transcriptional regulator [Flavobacterium araucananum]